jgi:hypothetical protein
MAKKRQVYIDVIVDDKGTVKRMAVDANKLDKALGKTGKTAKDTERNTKGVAQASSNGTKNFSKMAQGISGGLVPAYATLAAQIFAVSAAFNFLKDAGSLKLLEEGQMAYTASVGTSMKSLTQDIQRATGAQLSFREAAQAGAIGTAAGLTPDQITKLGKAARETSTILGRDLTDSFNRLVRGVTKAEPELLDELGIILRLDEATQKYKDNLDIKGPLTAFQRSQAVTADVLGQVEEKYSKVLAVTGGGANEFAKLATSFDDIINKIKSFSVKFLTPIAKILQEMPELIALAFAPFTAQIVNAAMPGVGAFQDRLKDFSKTAKTSFEDASKANKEFSDNIKKQKEGLIDPAQLQKEVQAEARTLQQKAKLRNNSIVARIAQGKTVEENELKQLQRSIRQQRGNYRNLNKGQVADLQVTMAKIRQINQTTSTAVSRMWQKTKLNAQVAFKGMEVAAKAAAAGIAKAFVAAGRAITLALSAVSWLSLIATLGTLVYSFFKTKDAAAETADSFDYMADKITNLLGETEEFIQVQNILNDSHDLGNRYLEAYGKKLGNISTSYLGSVIQLKQLTTLQDEYNNYIQEQSDLTLELADKLDVAQLAIKESQQGYGGAEAAALNAATAGKTYGDTLEKLIASSVNAGKSFSDFIDQQDVGTSKLSDAVKVLFDEKKIIDESTNARFKNNAAVQAYLQLLTQLEKGQDVSIKDIFEQRDAIQSLSANISELTRLQQENARTAQQLYTKLLPLNEYDTFLDKLSQEQFLIETTAKANGEKTEAEEKRLKVIKELMTFYQSLAEIETLSNSASVALDRTAFNLSKGKTKLIKDEIKDKVAIGKNEIKIFKTEQSILRAQKLAAKDRAAALQLIEKGNELEKTRGQEMLKTVDARGREIMLQTQNLQLLRDQTEEMRNQLSVSQQMKEVAMQSLENNLKSGLAALIKGTESSFKDSLLKLAKGVLDSVADFLAESMTKRIMKAITGAKDPDEKMAAAILTSTTTGASTISTGIVAGATQGANIIAARIIAASGGTATTPSGSTIPPGTGTPPTVPSGGPTTPLTPLSSGGEPRKGFWEMLLGTKQGGRTLNQEGNDVIVGNTQDRGVRTGGMFSNFISDFADVFDKNADGGFLEKMGNVFGSFGEGLSSLFKGLPDLLGSLFGGAGGGGGFLSALLNIFAPARYGGIMKGYATGGIARGRNAGYPAILHGTEAVVPLPSGGKIPVEMKSGGAANTNNVSISVNMSNDGNAETESQSDDQRGGELGKLLAQAVQDELQKQKRPGGILSPFGAA